MYSRCYFRSKADFVFGGGTNFPHPPPVFENLISPSFAIMMMLCEKKKKSSVVLGFQRGLSISGGEFAKTQTAGMASKCPMVRKSSRIDLKFSGQGNFGVGIANPASELPNSILLTRYAVAHSCMLLLQIREKNANKKYPVFLAPTPLLALLSTRVVNRRIPRSWGVHACLT